LIPNAMSLVVLPNKSRVFASGDQMYVVGGPRPVHVNSGQAKTVPGSASLLPVR